MNSQASKANTIDILALRIIFTSSTEINIGINNKYQITPTRKVWVKGFTRDTWNQYCRKYIKNIFSLCFQIGSFQLNQKKSACNGNSSRSIHSWSAERVCRWKHEAAHTTSGENLHIEFKAWWDEQMEKCSRLLISFPFETFPILSQWLLMDQ